MSFVTSSRFLKIHTTPISTLNKLMERGSPIIPVPVAINSAFIKSYRPVAAEERFPEPYAKGTVITLDDTITVCRERTDFFDRILGPARDEEMVALGEESRTYPPAPGESSS